MASDYGLNFGFRRSDETLRVSEGRYKTPSGGDPLLLGTAVEIDPDNEGFLRAAAADAKPRTGVCGLLVQEEEFDRSIYETDIMDSFMYGTAKKNRRSVITSGPGAKVWFHNSAAQSRADGRQIAAVTMVTGIDTLSVGDQLKWDGTTWVATAGDGTEEDLAHMEVTFVDTDRNLVEATLLK